MRENICIYWAPAVNQILNGNTVNYLCHWRGIRVLRCDEENQQRGTHTSLLLDESQEDHSSRFRGCRRKNKVELFGLSYLQALPAAVHFQLHRQLKSCVHTRNWQLRNGSGTSAWTGLLSEMVAGLSSQAPLIQAVCLPGSFSWDTLRSLHKKKSDRSFQIKEFLGRMPGCWCGRRGW